MTLFCTKIVSFAMITKFQILVRLEMENFRLTTTQDMFLERVGITNSFNDDNEYRYQPFFVSLFFFNNVVSGGKWHPICTHQKKGVIFCHFIPQKKFESGTGARATGSYYFCKFFF